MCGISTQVVPYRSIRERAVEKLSFRAGVGRGCGRLSVAASEQGDQKGFKSRGEALALYAGAAAWARACARTSGTIGWLEGRAAFSARRFRERKGAPASCARRSPSPHSFTSPTATRGTVKGDALRLHAAVDSLHAGRRPVQRRCSAIPTRAAERLPPHYLR